MRRETLVCDRCGGGTMTDLPLVILGIVALAAIVALVVIVWDPQLKQPHGWKGGDDGR